MSRLSVNLVRAGTASGWVFGARALGLAWTALLIWKLGIAEYGVYAIAYAIAAIVAAPIDNIFLVRSLRIDEAAFRAERSTRSIVGGVLMLGGIAAFVPAPVAGFALIVAGGEIVFNAVKSGWLRDGHPQVVSRWDAYRQAASIGLGAAYLVAIPEPILPVTLAVYALPYLVVILLAIRASWGTRPARPGTFRGMVLLWFDAMALALFLQGDIVLVGALASEAVAGLYSLGSVVSLAAASFAQMYVHTFHERLREAKGDPAAGPSRLSRIAVAIVLGAGVLAVGAVLAAIGETGVGVLLMVMSVYVVLRSLSIMLQTFLYVQGRDGARVAAGWVAVAVKLGLIVVLVGSGGGALGAAVAAIAAETVVVIWYEIVVDRPRREEAPS